MSVSPVSENAAQLQASAGANRRCTFQTQHPTVALIQPSHSLDRRRSRMERMNGEVR